MGTEIKSWEIREGRLVPVESRLVDAGRLETLDLEAWIASDPTIVRPGLRIVGRQVMTRSGPIDLLAIDRSGDLVVIELKRDRLPREVLAQAIDYTADVSSWSVEKIGEVCAKYAGDSLDDLFASAFPDVDLSNLKFNERQHIVLVGFSAETSLERMVEWLSDNYGVSVNVVILKYVKTGSGSEILTRTAVLSEELQEQRSRGKKFTIAMSDEPGQYPQGELRQLLRTYLSQPRVTNQRIREILLPATLARGRLSREELKTEFQRKNPGVEPAKAGFALSVISGQMGMEKNGFLRQIVGYEYPNNEWEKDNYFIRPEYRELVSAVLADLGNSLSSVTVDKTSAPR
jgi:hypothetical protein